MFWESPTILVGSKKSGLGHTSIELYFFRVFEAGRF